MTRAASWLVLLAALSIAGLAWGAPARRRARPAPTREYRDAVKRWHSAAGLTPVRDAAARPMLVLEALNTGERVELVAATDEGGFDADALGRASLALRDRRTGEQHPVEPRALDLVYRAMRHFSAPLVRVVSGYRAPKGAGTSNHGKGRALDVVLPGVDDAKLAAWARTLGFTGVGVYPNGGYCHLDVRERSYFWIDPSGPGQRSRETPVARAQAAQADARARARGVSAPSFLVRSADVDSALHGKTTASPPIHPHADDGHADDE